MKYILPGLLTLFMGILTVLPAALPARADSGNVTPVASAGIPALMIKVENTIQAGQPATITVLSRRSNEAVAGAPVYAIRTGGRAAPGHNNGTDNEFEASDQFEGIEFESLTGSDGIMIGTTGNDGTVSAALATAGRYLLIATSDGFIPGFARLQVKENARTARLNLQARASSPAGQQVTIRVTDDISGQATENATVYALKLEKNKEIKPMPPAANKGKGVMGLAVGDAERARRNGVPVGSTDSAGLVTYSFPTAGQYILAAFKAGYIPAFTRINITQAAALTPSTVPVTSSESPVHASPQPVTQGHGNGGQSHGDENEDD